MKIAYIMSRFPLLSETFILREMMEVEKCGHEIALYPIMCQDQPVVHEDAKKWAAKARCLPFFSGPILIENIRTFIKNPLKYLHIIIRIIWGNRSSLDFMIKGLYLFPKAVYTAKQLRLENVEHIHAHYATHPALKAWIIHKLTGIPYSVTIHSHDIYDCHAMLGPKLKDAGFLVPISKYNVKYLENLLGQWVREKCNVIRCGIDPSKYTASSKHRKTGDNLFQILQIGTLHWKKGQIYLIRAMATLKERNVPFQLRIVGEGDERQSIETEIQKYNLNGHVKLLGAMTQDEVASLIPTADCYIQSSVSEGIPVAIMEAMACELPVVSTNITGIPELVLDGQTGILVKSMDVLGMANALQTLYENPSRRDEMGKQGRDWVLKEFMLEKNAKKLAVLFEGAKKGNS
jgi:colanic acid/amylovoran biosynthesis glycosyltransferase